MVMRKLESIKFSGTPAPVSLAKSAQHKRELGNLLQPLCLNPFWALLPYLLPLWNQGFYFIRDYALIKPYLWRDFFSFSWLKVLKSGISTKIQDQSLLINHSCCHVFTGETCHLFHWCSGEMICLVMRTLKNSECDIIFIIIFCSLWVLLDATLVCLYLFL